MAQAEQEVPLIWTSKGNLPISDLRYESGWIDHEDYMSFTENYHLDDELVKSSTHVYNKKPLDLFSEQATL